MAVSSDRLNKDELVIDFEELKCLTESVLQGLRGQRLESLGIFESRNVSAEMLTRTLYDQLAPNLILPEHTVRLDYIEVTCDKISIDQHNAF